MTNNLNFLPGNPNNRLISNGMVYKLNDTNSLGYRAPEFDTIDWNNSIVIFGCSQVYGTGLNSDETISSHLSKLTGKPVINMGVPASSIFYSFINQMILAENNIKPLSVINCWTSTIRHAYFLDSNVSANLGPWLLNEDSPKNLNIRLYKRMFSMWNFNDYNSLAHSNFLRRTVKLIWSGTTHLEYSFFEHTAKNFNIEQLTRLDTASDNSHPGPDTARMVALKIFNDLK